MEEWVTLATFQYPLEAHVLRGKLESEQVECYLANEHLIGMNPLYSTAVGGVQLQVRRAEFDRAQRILERDLGVLEEDL